MSEHFISFQDSYPDATGPVPYSLTNDYLFRAVMQKNNHVLLGLICSLLHLTPSTVTSVTITNPIELGKSVSAKDFILDIRIILNHHTLINLEMQVLNQGNWPDRSLSYLCRTFDQLNQGQDYPEVLPVIHIGILDFTLFPEQPEFYSTYMFLNIRNHTIYSDKITLSVLNLTQIELATSEDQDYNVDYWARLFKATTWEEIRMLASKNDFLNEAANTMYSLSAEEQIRQQCEAREDFYRQQRYVEQKHKKELEELKEELSQKDALITELQKKLKELS